PAQHHVTPEPVVRVGAEGVIHMQALAEPDDLVDTARHQPTSAYFLQDYHVRILRLDDVRGSVKIEAVMHGKAALDVVGHHGNVRTDRGTGGRVVPGPDLPGAEQQQQPTYDTGQNDHRHPAIASRVHRCRRSHDTGDRD